MTGSLREVCELSAMALTDARLEFSSDNFIKRAIGQHRSAVFSILWHHSQENPRETSNTPTTNCTPYTFPYAYLYRVYGIAISGVLGYLTVTVSKDS